MVKLMADRLDPTDFRPLLKNIEIAGAACACLPREVLWIPI